MININRIYYPSEITFFFALLEYVRLIDTTYLLYACYQYWGNQKLITDNSTYRNVNFISYL